MSQENKKPKNEEADLNQNQSATQNSELDRLAQVARTPDEIEPYDPMDDQSITGIGSR